MKNLKTIVKKYLKMMFRSKKMKMDTKPLLNLCAKENMLVQNRTIIINESK